MFDNKTKLQIELIRLEKQLSDMFCDNSPQVRRIKAALSAQIKLIKKRISEYKVIPWGMDQKILDLKNLPGTSSYH